MIQIKNVDVYVTGSNSKFLSKDIITEFRGRGDEVHLYPLSFGEFFKNYNAFDNGAFNFFTASSFFPSLIMSLKKR